MMTIIKQIFQKKYLKITGDGTQQAFNTHTLKKSRSPAEPTANKFLGSFKLKYSEYFAIHSTTEPISIGCSPQKSFSKIDAPGGEAMFVLWSAPYTSTLQHALGRETSNPAV